MSFSATNLIQANDIVTDVFTQRQSLMPMWGNTPIATEQWQTIWANMLDTPLTNQSLVYINIPFCINHCVFCGFYKNKWKENQGKPYVDRLIAELAFEASKRPSHGSIDAVYLGGGTPTALSSYDLSRLIHALYQYLPLDKNCEVTVEGRISHFDQKKIEACLKAGANRFSIGVQTFNSTIRQKLGRKHPKEAIISYMRHLASFQEAVVVLDLIFGLPGQTDEIWQDDLKTALSLGLDGLDVYAFNCYPMLPINRMIEKGALPALPDISTQARQYAFACRYLQSQNWTHISNSHFASPTKTERNIYNAQIKSGATCLAFGSGAGGCHAGYTYSVTANLEEYLHTPIDQKPFGHISQVSEHKQWFGQLQGNIEKGILHQSILPTDNTTKELLTIWENKGLLTINEDKLNLTIAGRFWAPTMIRTLANIMTS